ncbi:cytochrome c [Methylotuvimicrobium buryatense]|uniref:Cytochrome c n=2 Tax=Methylotuvimicrobium buryatense TaxID=95641 RepID=A0A4P9UTE2_METBY|nr:cytochrome c [Methylotuvimicrobium buryatense]
MVVADELIGPGLGLQAPPEMLKQWNRDVFPDGTGLPLGRGTVREGETVYRAHCIGCHGSEGRGGSAEELAGAEHSLIDDPPDKTIGTYWPYATTLFDFTRRSMPLSNPGSLTDDQVYAVTAYLLYLNRIIGPDDEMNAQLLPAVVMPNQDGFIDNYRRDD